MPPQIKLITNTSDLPILQCLSYACSTKDVLPACKFYTINKFARVLQYASLCKTLWNLQAVQACLIDTEQAFVANAIGESYA